MFIPISSVLTIRYVTLANFCFSVLMRDVQSRISELKGQISSRELIISKSKRLFLGGNNGLEGRCFFTRCQTLQQTLMVDDTR